MADLSQTIQAKSDQLNADDLMSGPITITVTKVSRQESPDQPISIHYEGDQGKPYKPCKSMRRVLVQLWGKDGATYARRKMTLYRDDKVTFGAMAVGGIRISHLSDIKEKMTLALTATRANKKPYVVLPLAGAATPAAKPISEETMAAGNAAARNGVKAYTEWKDSLAPDVKETIRPHHAEWAKIAKDSDDRVLAEIGVPPSTDDDAPPM